MSSRDGNVICTLFMEKSGVSQVLFTSSPNHPNDKLVLNLEKNHIIGEFWTKVFEPNQSDMAVKVLQDKFKDCEASEIVLVGPLKLILNVLGLAHYKTEQ